MSSFWGIVFHIRNIILLGSTTKKSLNPKPLNPKTLDPKGRFNHEKKKRISIQFRCGRKLRLFPAPRWVVEKACRFRV